MTSLKQQTPELCVSSDASGSWGCGTVHGNEWFQLQWLGLGETMAYDIVAKEMLPIVIAVALWVPTWEGKTIRAWCDDEAVVAIVNTGSSREKTVMHLSRCLVFMEARWQCHIVAKHIRGLDNRIADAVSRNELVTFSMLCPQAQPEAARIPGALLDLLVREKPDWTNDNWTRLWKAYSLTM